MINPETKQAAERPAKVGFYNRVSQDGFQTLGFSWYDKKNNYHQVEAHYIETDPLMAAHFLESFSVGLRKRIEDGVDAR
jgi:hypothetical protein